MIKLAVAGALGRTGRRVVELALADPRFRVVSALCSPTEVSVERRPPFDDPELMPVDQLSTDAHVLIDFTLPEGTAHWLTQCRKQKLPMVIGTTGHDPDQGAKIEAAACDIPIVRSSNFSTGINLLMNQIGQLARELGNDYDIEIVETHHRDKVDAPSGTARTIVAEITGENDSDISYGRVGQVGPRPRGQIGIHAVRMGDVVGRHEVLFSGPGETIRIEHTAHSRDTFAVGALRAAAWVVGQPPGLYSMKDVLR